MEEKKEEEVTFLASDEFIILQDDTCHLVLGSGLQISFAPSLLYLTNRQIYVRTSIGKPEIGCIFLNDITNFEQKDVNGTNVLVITGKTSSQILRISFISIDDHQLIFADILSKLLASTEQSPAVCDALSLSLQRKVKEAPSLQEFYASFLSIKDTLTETPTASTPQNTTIEILTNMTPTSLKLIDVVDDTITRSEILFFACLSTITAILSILFHFIPFGVCITVLLFVLVSNHGLRLLFGQTTHVMKVQISDPKFEKQFHHLIASYDKFWTAFEKRFLWKNRRQTMETAAFLLSASLLFLYFDPAFILTLSLIGLALIERWDPLHIGCLSDIGSKLFQF